MSLLDWAPIGGDLLSLGLGYSADKKNRRLQRDQMAMAQRQFDSQMDQSVQRRVADARKAGIHPLFALGASVGASPTLSSGGGRETNEAGRAAQGLARNLAAAQIAKTEAEAMLAASQAARVRQDMHSQGRDLPEVAPGFMGPGARMGAGGVGPSAPRSVPNRDIPQISVSRTYADRYNEKVRRMPARPTQLYLDVWDQARGEWVQVFNPDLGLDEVGQIFALGSIAESEIRRWFNKIKPDMTWEEFKRKYGRAKDRR